MNDSNLEKAFIELVKGNERLICKVCSIYQKEFGGIEERITAVNLTPNRKVIRYVLKIHI